MFIVTLSFTVGFGESDTQDLLKTWAMSLAFVVFTVEPINILVAASLPFMISKDGWFGGLYQRIYTLYSELFT